MVWLEKSKNRKRATEHFKKFSQLLQLLINVNRTVALQRKGMEIASFFANSRWEILPPLLLPGGRYWEFPSGFSTHFSQCPAAVQQHLRAFRCGYQLKHGNIHPYSVKGRVSVYTFLKFEGTFKNFKKPQRLLS